MEIVDTNWQAQLEMLVSVAIAVVLGGLVGLEREFAHKPAGVRTHALLAAAACPLVVLTDVIIAHYATDSPPSLLRADPVRIIAAIVTGTAFLGAGTIFRHGTEKVEGLTTAASLLLVAAVGVAVGLEQVFLAVMVTVLTLVLLRVAGAVFAAIEVKGK
jgi:putative Mg2+ transporter-C (MgtC) family protein